MGVDPDRLKEELRKMKQLIDSDTRVRAHFDTDGNGIIDGDEWEAVRRLVVRRLEREAEEAALSEQMRAAWEAGEAAEDEEAGRDFSNLELAFDPRNERAEKAKIAEEIYERDMARRYADARGRSGALRSGESLGDFRELVLEQKGGAKMLFGAMFRRTYEIQSTEGEVLGEVAQVENEMLQNLGHVSVFELPDLSFRVYDRVADAEYRFTRSRGLAQNEIYVEDPNGRIISRASWTLSFLRRKYEIRPSSEGVSYYARRPLLRPLTYEVLDPFEEPIGEMQRGWSGFGFLSGANLFHIGVDDEISADVMWGIIATALLADLDAEAQR